MAGNDSRVGEKLASKVIIIGQRKVNLPKLKQFSCNKTTSPPRSTDLGNNAIVDIDNSVFAGEVKAHYNSVDVS